MKRITLILIGLMVCATAFAQSQFPSANVRPVTNEQEKITKLFWLNTTDTSSYDAGDYPGAIMFQKITGDTTLYYSDGIKWVPLGSSSDLSNYLEKSDSSEYGTPTWIDSISRAIAGDSVALRVSVNDTTGRWAPAGSYLHPADTSYLHNIVNSKADTGLVIKNQTAIQSGANFNIAGNGVIGGVMSIGKSYSNHGGYQNALDLLGGVTMQRGSDAYNTYLLAGFNTSGGLLGSIMINSANDLYFYNNSAGRGTYFYTSSPSGSLTYTMGLLNGQVLIKNTPMATVGSDSIIGKSADGTLKVFSPNDFATPSQITDTLAPIEITKDEFNIKSNNNSLLESRWYKITDATSEEIPIYAFAESGNSIDSGHIKVPGYYYTSAEYSPSTDIVTLTDRFFGVIRCVNGVWDWVADPGHDKYNFDSVYVDSSGSLIVNYIKQNYYTGVGDIIASVDNNYPFWGVTLGSSVGTNYTGISLYRSFNLSDSIYWNGVAFKSSNDYITTIPTDSAVFNESTSTLIVYQHDTIPKNLNPSSYSEQTAYPTLTDLDGGYHAVLAGSSPSGFSVKFYDNTGTLITAPDAKCRFIYNRTAANRVIKGTDAYREYLSQSITNIWLQGWMHKTIE